MTKRSQQAADYAAEVGSRRRDFPPPHDLGNRIANALGLERCVELTLHFKAGELPLVVAKMLVRPEHGAAVVGEIATRRWRLIEDGIPVLPAEDVVAFRDMMRGVMTPREVRAEERRPRGSRWLRSVWLWFVGR